MCGTVVSETTRKARKQHRCEACKIPIPPGFLYQHTFEKDGGDVFSGKWHQECREAFGAWLREDGDDCGDPWMTWECWLPPLEVCRKYVPDFALDEDEACG